MKKFSIGMFAALACSAVWAGPLDNAWIKGETDKDPVSYKTGEKMVLYTKEIWK